MTVAELTLGEKAQIIDFKDSQLGLLLSEMGFLIGETIQITSVAPLGDPICISTQETQLSIRRESASSILVQKIDL